MRILLQLHQYAYTHTESERVRERDILGMRKIITIAQNDIVLHTNTYCIWIVSYMCEPFSFCSSFVCFHLFGIGVSGRNSVRMEYTHKNNYNKAVCLTNALSYNHTEKYSHFTSSKVQLHYIFFMPFYVLLDYYSLLLPIHIFSRTNSFYAYSRKTSPAISNPLGLTQV